MKIKDRLLNNDKLLWGQLHTLCTTDRNGEDLLDFRPAPMVTCGEGVKPNSFCVELMNRMIISITRQMGELTDVFIPEGLKRDLQDWPEEEEEDEKNPIQEGNQPFNIKMHFCNFLPSDGIIYVYGLDLTGDPESLGHEDGNPIAMVVGLIDKS